MTTRKASFRLWAIIICFGVLALAACATQRDTTQQDPCIEERNTMAEYQEDPVAPPTFERALAVAEKHIDLIMQYPHYRGSGVGKAFKIPHPDENQPDGNGILVRVWEWTDPERVPEGQRIPECLDGVPVKIIEDTTPAQDNPE